MVMEKPRQKVLYETRLHASRPFSPKYPPQQANDGVKGSFLSFPIQAVRQLKEKWGEYNQPRKLRKLMSLFISPRGEHVAVAAGNQIIIFRKEDDFQEPCGVFTSALLGTFTIGTWSERHDVLGVVDETDTLYFIKGNGEEITRITMRQLKISLPIVGLITQEDSDAHASSLCSFIIVTSDGSLQSMEIGRDPSISISLARSSDSDITMKGKFPSKVFCYDYHPDLSMFVIVGSFDSMSLTSNRNPGSSYLSLWRRSRSLDLEQLFSTQFDGLYFKPKGHTGHMSYIKLRISLQAQYIATLDVTGRLYIFKLDKEHFSVSKFSSNERQNSQVTSDSSHGEEDSLTDVWDFSWWSDHILTISKRCGTITMFDILSGLKVQEDPPVYSMPILERVQHLPGLLFVLGSTVSEEKFDTSKHMEHDGLHYIDLITEDTFNHFEVSRLQWSLISFSERSVAEMYNVLISNKKYYDALNFADCYGLDKDEVMKSQWLHSGQGIKEINSFLSEIKDKVFVLSECVDKVGPTEDSVKALLSYGLRLTDKCRFSEKEIPDEYSQIWNFRLARLQLLQFRDKLETFLGINMGRFSVQEYRKFRVMPMNEAAVTLAQSGKIGALNLLFKRHPYSLNPFMLEILNAIPETVPVQTYGQLLPGRSPPNSLVVREEDWVECEKMISFMNLLPENHEISNQIRTEPIVKQCRGLIWPSIDELVLWFTNRARDIDTLSGQLDNSLCLLDFAIRKGICELQQFYEDVSYLHQLIYMEDSDDNFSITVGAWEQLSHYDKFRMMLRDVSEENLVKRLLDKAIPFMRKRSNVTTSDPQDFVTDTHHFGGHGRVESFLVRWMKEVALENKLEICLTVIQEAWGNLNGDGLFTNEVEAVDCALQCIYMSSVTDRWSTMGDILSKLPQIPGTGTFEDVEKRLKLAEGHIEAGRLLSFYQVPKPLNYFLEAHRDGKGVKQILRLILSKFIRRQPGRSDNDWANLWRDMLCLREKAFPFLDVEYMLTEFCRGLLKAGKFSLARNYLKGTSSVSLASDKAENLVIQAAREYFFSASSLSCPEIWKAKECLNLFPNSRNIKAEVDIIDVLIVKLPSLGVTLLPMQFRQIKDPMEIMKMVISSQTGAYLHVDELIDVSKLLGLSSVDDISAVEEAIAREAAVAGDLQLAFDLCLVLAKKGHGPVWDLCAAIARGPALENMDISSRKQLLGFALSHCDEESISELLHAWKDLDMQGQCETLIMLTGTGSPTAQSSFHDIQSTIDVKDELVQGINSEDQEVLLDNLRNTIYTVAKNWPIANRTSLESFIRENGKVLSFASSQLPWLLELSRNAENGKKLTHGLIPGKQFVSLRTQALVTILSWLARNGFIPTDNLIISLAKSVIEPPVTKEEDLIGCSFLLNLVDAFNGVEAIEEQLRTRENYQEVCSITHVGMTYCLLHNSGVECETPAQRRELLLRKFREKHTPPNFDESDKIDTVQSSFWREWKLKLEEQKRVADHSRALEHIIPGVETARFLSGDFSYIETVVLSLIESVKLEKKHILKEILKLADTYGLNHSEVLLRYLTSIFLSEVWTNDDIMVEISDFRSEIIDYAVETIKVLSVIVYPAIDGSNKLRLAYIYGLLSDCYLELEKTGVSPQMAHMDQSDSTSFGVARFYKVIEEECRRVSFIKNLNFKNIVGLDGLNFQCFSSEVYTHTDVKNLEALAKMVETLVSIYSEPVPEGLISWQDVYKHYILKLLTSLEKRVRTEFRSKSPESLLALVSQLEESYDLGRNYVKLLARSDALHTMRQFFRVIIPLSESYGDLPDNSMWQDSLITLLKFWIRLTEEMIEIANNASGGESLRYSPECLASCLKVFNKLVIEDSVSPSQGWNTIMNYANYVISGDFALEAFVFCRAMVLSSCGFGAIAEVFFEAVSQHPTVLTLGSDMEVQDLSHLYLKVLEHILEDLVSCSSEHQNLHSLLSSLSKLDGDLEELKRARRVVWERMAMFSDNLQVSSSVRVYVLELMQFITGRNIKGIAAEIQYNIQPWEGWDEVHYRVKEGETISVPGLSEHKDTSSNFTSTLVALKSSQLAGTISPSLEVTTDDLLSVQTSVSCFLKLCEAATKDSHFDILLTILAEWEGLFISGRDEAPSLETTGGNDWNTDSWDEGWESFQDSETVEYEKGEITPSIHPLHVCWLEIFKRLISLSRFEDVINLVDQSLTKSNEILLDEDSIRKLSHILIGADCFSASKMVMLFPYEALKLECLDAVEGKLKQDGISDAISGDLHFLTLILFSGVISSIITKESYGNIFSYLCYLVGKFSHQLQESQLSNLTRKGSGNNERDMSHLFRKTVFPCFVSELVKADQQVLAAFIVTKFMHTNASLSLVNIAEASLRKYLEKELQTLQSGEFGQTDTYLHNSLRNAVSKLREKLGSSIQSALSLL